MTRIVKYPVKTHTELRVNGDFVTNYRGTDVVTIKPDGKVVLNSNGWHTHTTKQRMNQYAGSGICVYQKDFEWFVTVNGKTFDYFDGIVIDPS